MWKVMVVQYSGKHYKELNVREFRTHEEAADFVLEFNSKHPITGAHLRALGPWRDN